MGKLQRIATRPGFWLAAGALGIGAYTLLRATGVGFRKPGLRELPESGPRIVILGAGFAGLAAASKLREHLGNNARILLVDRHNYHLFTPLLFQVGTCGVDPYDAAYPVHQFAGRHSVGFWLGTVTGIDLTKQKVQLDNGEIPYDYLIVALGSITNFLGNQAAQRYALPLKSLEDSVAIRNHVIDIVEQAAMAMDSRERKALLTFAVVGGGATGVETAAALNDLLRNTVPRDFPNIDPAFPRVLVLEAKEKLLGHMGERISSVALDRLRSAGVEVWLNARAKDVSPDTLITEDGRTLSTRTVIWATGVSIPTVVTLLSVEHGRGGSLKVDEYLRIPGHPEVFAAGDNAAITDFQTSQAVPLLAASAIQAGEAVATNVAHAIHGKPLVPFRYRPLGNAITLGRSAGAIEVGGLVVDGFAGWLGWRLIHLARLTSFRNKLATLLDWGIGYVVEKDMARLDLAPAKAGAKVDGGVG